VENQVIQTPKGFLIFDDTVADKNFLHEMVKLFQVVLSAFGKAHELCCDQRYGVRECFENGRVNL
jgi:hypothetical protein